MLKKPVTCDSLEWLLGNIGPFKCLLDYWAYNGRIVGRFPKLRKNSTSLEILRFLGIGHSFPENN